MAWSAATRARVSAEIKADIERKMKAEEPEIKAKIKAAVDKAFAAKKGETKAKIDAKIKATLKAKHHHSRRSRSTLSSKQSFAHSSHRALSSSRSHSKKGMSWYNGGVDILTPYQPKPRYIPKNNKDELQVQRAVCRYLDLQFPKIIYRSDFASGMHLTPYQARMHASLQSSKGWVDLFIYQPSRSFHGMGLEIKKSGTTIILKTGPRKGKVTSDPHIQEQAAMINELRHKGYYADFGVGIDDCIKKINWYFKVKENAELF